MNEQMLTRGLETYFHLMSINGAAHVLKAAGAMDVLDRLGADPQSAEAIASDCDVQPASLALLLDVLVALDVLEKQGDLYALGAVAKLIRGNYRDLGERYWEYLGEFLKTGAPMMEMNALDQIEKQYQAQAASLEWMMLPSAERASQLLDIGGERRNLRILDIGAGSAVWSMTFALRDPGAHVTALDWPAVLEVARAGAVRRGLETRFMALPGNYHEVEWPIEAFDLVVMANVTHLESMESNLALFRRAWASLIAGGEIVIVDVFPGQKQGDLPRALYALGLALRTRRGVVHSPEVLAGLLESAGFQAAKPQPLDVLPWTMGILAGRKAAIS